MPRPDEFSLIAKYFAPLASGASGAYGLGDDAASYTPTVGHALVLTVDAIVEGVHFLPTDPAEDVARKLLRVNLSDLAAKGATPRGYLLTTAWTAATPEDWIASFARGLGADQSLFGLSLWGGDTVSTPGPLSFTLTAIGEVKHGGMLRRTGALAGMISGLRARLVTGRSVSLLHWASSILRRTFLRAIVCPNPALPSVSASPVSLMRLWMCPTA